MASVIHTQHTQPQPTTTVRLDVPVRRTVQTRSGSRSRIHGRQVRKIEAYGDGADYILVDMRGDRLRYTDGQRLYISSPVVGTRSDPV